jgi:hypothetical protein
MATRWIPGVARYTLDSKSSIRVRLFAHHADWSVRPQLPGPGVADVVLPYGGLIKRFIVQLNSPAWPRSASASLWTSSPRSPRPRPTTSAERGLEMFR